METYIHELLSQLTLEEKISMVHGATLFRTAPVERLGIPALSFSDGPMGVRFEFKDAEWVPAGNNDDFVTYLPCNSAIASTWNPELARRAGSVLGAEARARGKDVILAPGINIKRHPACGRNFEYMSEDPRLVEEMVIPMVQGVQQHDTAACVKHFAANFQETDRLQVDTVASERALREIYYPGFKAAVQRGGVHCLMGAYNKLYGQHCCTGEKLLGSILRDEWGYDGLVVSDWGGVHDTMLAAHSGLDVEMDVTYDFAAHHMADSLAQQIRAGKIPEELLDRKIRNILRLMLRLKMIGPEAADRSPGAYNVPEHHQAALEVAEESLILLKNQDHLLPLDPKTVGKVAVIGANAAVAHAFGGGSAEIKALYEITPLMGIKMLLGGNAKVTYAPGYYTPPAGGRPEISWQANSTAPTDGMAVKAAHETNAEASRRCLEEAVSLAKESDTVIFIGGLDHNYDVEGVDRNDLRLPYGQDALLQALLEVKPDTVVVLYAGSPVEMPWLSQAKALLWSYYAGMEGGTAIARTLFGRTNPSGKLAETMPVQEADCAARRGVDFAVKGTAALTEGVMVGYRHYDTQQIPVNFCFGHGLSYTTFQYDDVTLNGREISCTVTNIGSVFGKETVQLYVAPLEQISLPRPVHELKHFQKVALAPGESCRVSFTLTDMDFSVYDEVEAAFTPIAGCYRLQIGASSRDIRLSAQIKV